MSRVTDLVALSALAQRLTAIAPLLNADADGDVLADVAADVAADRDEQLAERTAQLLDLLVTTVAHQPTDESMWLLFVAVTGRYPAIDDVVDLRRLIALSDTTEVTLFLLDEAARPEAARRNIEIVHGGVLVDVDHVARSDHHTGIQQVIRSFLPYWHSAYSIVPAAWTDSELAFRPLVATEVARVLPAVADTAADGPATSVVATILVPVNCVVVMPDVPRGHTAPALAGIGALSGNRLVYLGYDCIPVVSAHLMPLGSTDDFARFLSGVKYAKRVAAISETAAIEFRGFVAALAAQGGGGPEVVACPLVTEVAPQPPAVGSTDGELPMVLAVGSFEPRKNQLGLLHAAEVLWREGLRFQVKLIGGSTFGDTVDQVVTSLADAGRPVSIVHRATSAELQASFGSARVLAFPSLHEGYGLPIVEALAVGTPVITSNVGSMAELAASGGVLVVDPYNDSDLTDALRRVLTDDDLHARLSHEAVGREHRGWEQYASDLWSCLVKPELSEPDLVPVRTTRATNPVS